MERTIHEAKELNRRNGYFFFSEDTMNFFASEIETEIRKGCYFITSEKRCFDDRNRVYTIREVNWDTGNVFTADGFEKFDKLIDAERALDSIKITKRY